MLNLKSKGKGVSMNRKNFTIKLVIVVSLIIGLVSYSFISFESKKINICLNGWVLSESNHLISSGSGANGPWIVLRDEDDFYKYMSSRGSRIRLGVNDSRFAPKELTGFTSIGNEAIRVEVNAGQYIYVVMKDSSIAVWSISL